MRRYPEYKESGVEWIGKIPAHWTVRRNKRIFNERDDRSATGKEELLTVSHITGVSPRAEKNVGMFLAETLEGYKHCSVGNLVINTMWAWMGALGISEFDGIVSPSYNVYQLKNGEYLPKYYDYLYRTPNHVSEIIRWSKGIWHSRLRLYPDAFFSMFTITLPFSEQTQIADFLDRKTGQIDELIRIKERRIELLQEQRTVLINQAVTKGLDPNVEMKSSGVEWIGKIPKDREVTRLKYICELIVDCEHKTAPTQETGYPLIRTPNIGIGHLILDNVNRVSEATYQEWSRHTIPQSGDLILAREAPVGNVAIIPKDLKVCLGQRTVLIRPDKNKVYAMFLVYLMLGDETQVKLLGHSTGAIVHHLNMTDIRNLELPRLPSLPIQHKIANFLDHKTQQIDELISTEQRKIELLREYRQSLISEVVTGKIDVRIDTPDESSEV